MKNCDNCKFKHESADVYPCYGCQSFSNWKPRSLDDASPAEWDRAAAAARGVVQFSDDTVTVTGGSASFTTGTLHHKPKATDVQVGGSHYKDFAIQPAEFIQKNAIPYLEGCAIKYLVRWRKKGGVQDLEKAKHYIDLLIEMEAK